MTHSTTLPVSIHLGQAVNEYILQHSNRIHPREHMELTLLARDLLEGDHTNWTLQMTASSLNLSPYT
jgi:hypothetical protein